MAFLPNSSARAFWLPWEPCVFARCHRNTTPVEDSMIEGTLPIRTVQPPGLRFGNAGKNSSRPPSFGHLCRRPQVQEAQIRDFTELPTLADHPIYRLVNGWSGSFGCSRKTTLGCEKYAHSLCVSRGYRNILYCTPLRPSIPPYRFLFGDRAGRRVKHRFWLVSGLYLRRHLPDFRACSFGTTAGPRSRIGWKNCRGESSECQEKNQLHIFGASVEKRWMIGALVKEG